jgi:hypothetical protein
MVTSTVEVHSTRNSFPPGMTVIPAKAEIHCARRSAPPTMTDLPDYVWAAWGMVIPGLYGRCEDA